MLSGTPRTFIGSTTFTVRGLVDDDESTTLADSVAAVPGVDSVTVDLTSGAVTVRVSRLVDRADIEAAINEAGFVLVP
jgi:copper chaperone CopZ